MSELAWSCDNCGADVWDDDYGSAYDDEDMTIEHECDEDDEDA